MKTILLALCMMLLCVPATTSLGEVYQTEGSYYTEGLLSPEELDDLLAPIALYPDPLIAQILPAATFVDQIEEAARFVRVYGRSRIDVQPWDVSVKAVAHYPGVLFMMEKRYEWTASLGQAFINQEQDVLDTIQDLRADARAAGSLVSTPQQQVLLEGDYIRIIPAEPKVIYVPQYDPDLVYYGGPYPSYGLITFSVGFSIGSWLNRDCDWHRHRIYYHGWRGGGWIYRTRPYVNVRNRTYIDRRHRDIRVNRRIIERDTVRFRSELRRGVEQRREEGRIRRSPAAPQIRSRRVAPPTATAPGSSAPVIQRRVPDGAQRPQGQAPSDTGGRSNRQQGRMSRDTIRQSDRQPLTTAPPTTERLQRSAPTPGAALAPGPAPAVRPPAARESAPATRTVPRSSEGESTGRSGRTR